MAAKKRSQAGLTMIEVLVASIILTALVAMSSWLIWGSSKHVSRMEAEMTLENQAREFIGMLTKELHQANMSNVQWVDDAQLIDFRATADTPGFLQATVPLAGTGRPMATSAKHRAYRSASKPRSASRSIDVEVA